MAGGPHPPKMAVKKNIYFEEWNGNREITEKTFEVGFGQVPTLVLYLMVIPYGIYAWSRAEHVKRGDDLRYNDMV